MVTLPEWKHIKETPPPADAPFTTVMTWAYLAGKLTHKGVEYGTKVPEYARFHDLPRRTNIPLMLAVGGPKAPLAEIAADGWRTIPANDATLTARNYQDFIRDSQGEWSVAKNVYTATRSGWFSCRTACYLAAGRPAVVQETGWSKFVPSGKGLIAFSTMEEAIAGLKEVTRDPMANRAAAYEIAREYLAPDRVLPGMIEAIVK